MNQLSKLISYLKQHNPEKAGVILKLAAPFQGQCNVFDISESSDDHSDFPDGRDYYDILNDVEKIFKSSGINILSVDNFHEACIDGEGFVHGATVISHDMNHEEERSVIRFSIAVESTKRNMGVAKKLIQSIINQYKSHCIVEAFVINPHMVPLLESLGFSSDGDWSEYNPVMTFNR